MAISQPTIFQWQGLYFSLKGQPGKRRLRIHLLQRGEWKTEIQQHPEIVTAWAANLAALLRQGSPKDTGMLRNSIRVEAGKVVSLGPDPYDRTLLKARLAGRQTVKRRRRGRPRLSQNYHLWANVTSFRPEYLEMGMEKAADDLRKAFREIRAIEEDRIRLELLLRRI